MWSSFSYTTTGQLCLLRDSKFGKKTFLKQLGLLVQTLLGPMRAKPKLSFFTCLHPASLSKVMTV